MASSTSAYKPTLRDSELLRAIELLSPTAKQLLKWSQSFEGSITPFTNIGDLRRRLTKMHAARLVRRWRFAIESEGMLPYYYKLSPEGHRALYGKGATPKTSRAFSPIGISLHSHTNALAEFMTHTHVSAHRIGASFTDVYAENEYRVTVGDESLRLDGRGTLLQSTVRKVFNLELDCSTESIISSQGADSIGRKIRLLDADDSVFEPHDPGRAITLFVCTRSRERVLSILDAAASLVRNPNRSLIYGIYLPDYLALTNPLTATCFLNHRHESVALLSENLMQDTTPAFRKLTLTSVVR